MEKYSVLVVDDEALARRRIRQFLRDAPDMEVVAECRNGREAAAALAEHTPDLIFLDVEMPGMSGFDLLGSLGPARAPVVIFVTAHDEFALRAFDFEALDYLLKPFHRERFEQAVERARARIREKRQPQGVGQAPPRAGAAPGEGPRRLAFRISGRVILIAADEIRWVEAAGNYLRVRAGNDSHMIRERLSSFEGQLDPRRFVRIHRSTIVNIDFVKELHPAFNGDQIVIMRDGTRFSMSRTHRSNLFSRL